MLSYFHYQDFLLVGNMFNEVGIEWLNFDSGDLSGRNFEGNQLNVH